MAKKDQKNAVIVKFYKRLALFQWLRTASEFKSRELGTPGFGSTLMRHILFAVYKAAETEKRDDCVENTGKSLYLFPLQI